MNAKDSGKAVDGNPDTAWITPRYDGFPNFGNLTGRLDGSGIIVDLGSVQNVSGVDIDLYAPGQKIQVRAAGPEGSPANAFSDFNQTITKLETAQKKLQATLETPIRTRYVLVHITSLPSEGSGDSYRGGINEIKVLGQAG